MYDIPWHESSIPKSIIDIFVSEEAEYPWTKETSCREWSSAFTIIIPRVKLAPFCYRSMENLRDTECVTVLSPPDTGNNNPQLIGDKLPSSANLSWFASIFSCLELPGWMLLWRYRADIETGSDSSSPNTALNVETLDNGWATCTDTIIFAPYCAQQMLIPAWPKMCVLTQWCAHSYETSPRDQS